MIFFSIIERDQHGIDYQKKFFSIKYQCESRSMTREKKKGSFVRPPPSIDIHRKI